MCTVRILHPGEGFVFSLRRDGDQLVVGQSGEGKNGRTEPTTCGANGHADGNFFLTGKP